ncbi:hypothetical protein K458DRAFT_435224 [Lentithecium fluviatile CBS 122367]|uniref:Hydrophobin n=1 Tax=Lentithecium fluviatile CBS 122367 TaxID=1168545 RepID=A0A6G1IMQ5_9PLEO|nr:hypothetical protein K458DRAFT_435224 [Lentithecium fluviatile CBS 122367]
MKSFVAILSLAVLTAASPVLETRTPLKSPQDASEACGENVVTCCNGSGEQNSSGLISAIVGPIASNGCIGVGIQAIALLNPITSTGGMCSDNEVKCCSGNKNSDLLVVDLQCTSL